MIGFLLTALVVVGTSIWVLVDSIKLGAKSVGSTPVVWFIGCLFMWIIVFPVYLFQRRGIIKAVAATRSK